MHFLLVLSVLVFLGAAADGPGEPFLSRRLAPSPAPAEDVMTPAHDIEIKTTAHTDAKSNDFMAKLEKHWVNMREQAAPMVDKATSFLHLSFNKAKGAFSELETWQAVLVSCLLALVAAAVLATALRCVWAVCRIACWPCVSIIKSRRTERRQKEILRLIPGITTAHPLKTRH
eukprot:Gregarina_sp_Poly_1__7483@NODE_416_length_8734_cov_134_157609_g338_i0_p6_GENE_NODE_416_length_8734_cov_134_157609_g338_i0NODE_416_length_8734_cov_134_157609_g338_i0_p6_ORF_typecomplete_len173_score23_14_NODE_416_length_8734_cov_134_157609_g338_i080828600